MKHSLRKLTVVALLLLTVACGDSQTSSEHLEKAKQYLADDSYEAALIELKNAVRKDEQSPEARFLLGKLQLESGASAAAEKELQAALRLGWPTEQVSPALARAMLAERQFAKIRELDTTALPAAAKAEVLTVQSVSELAQGELDSAERLIAEAEAAAPDSIEVMIGSARVSAGKGEMDAASRQLQAALELDPDNAVAWHLLGDVKLNSGDAEAAYQAFNKALEIQPNNYQARLRRALVAMTRSEFDVAREDAEVLLEQAPRNPGSHYVRGLTLFQDKNFPDAISALAQAEPAFREYPMVLYYLASAHFSEGNFELAESFAERFVAVSPDNVAGRKLLATLRLRRQDFRDVQSLMEPVLASNPDDIGALSLMANALIGDGKTDRGITLLNRIAELQPDSAQAQVRLGAGLLMQGDNDRAVEHIETALELDPAFQQADILLVLNHLRKKEYDQAIAAAQAYSTRNPVSVTPHNLMGRVYLEAGQPDSARKAFEDALKVDKGDFGANQNLAQMALDTGDLDTARERYRAILDQYPDAAAAMLELAKLEARAGNEAAMVDWMQKAVDAQPEALQPRVVLARYNLNKGRPEQVALLFSTLDSAQRQSPEVLRLTALAQLAERQPFEAQSTLEQLLEETPDTAEIRLLLAQAAVAGGDLDRGRRELRSALAIDDSYLPARVALARLELLGDDRKAFEEQLDWLVANAPEDPNVLQLQARREALEGRHDAAVEFARQAYSAAPNQKTLLVLTRYQVAAGDVDSALALMQDWLNKNPSDMGIRLAMGIGLVQAGRSAEAIKEYQAVLETDPDNFAALNNLAWETRQSDPTAALGYARRAVDVAPGNAAALDTLAMVEYYNGDYRAAERSISRALDAAPDQPSMLFHKAMIDKALGDEALAARSLKRLLEEQPEFPEAAEARSLLESLKP